MIKKFLSAVALLFATPAFAGTYVIGDSIAVGIANSNGLDRGGTWRKGGKDTAVVLGFVRKFIATGKASGSTVILSSGASNSTYERPNGTGRNLDVSLIHTQIRLLKTAGVKVYLIGTGSKHSPWIHNKYGMYRVNFAAQNVNARLAEVARQEGAVFLGPLEKYGKLGDGIHPGSMGARAIYKEVK